MDAPSSAITEVAGRKKAPAKSPSKPAPASNGARTPATKVVKSTSFPAPAPVAPAAPGKGRRAVTLKDGRVKADVLKDYKSQLSASKTTLSNHSKNVKALDKQVSSFQKDIDAGKAAAAALKNLRPEHKKATGAWNDHNKAHNKLQAEHDKIKAYQPK